MFKPRLIGITGSGRPIFAIAGADGATNDPAPTPDPTDAPDLLAELDDIASVSDERLAEMESELITMAEAAAAERDTEALEHLRESVTTVREEATRRIAAAQEAETRVAELMEGIRPEATEPVPDPTPDPDPEPAPDPAPDAPPAVTVEDDSVVSAARARALSRRRPSPPPSHQPAPTTDDTQISITAGGDIPGYSAGSTLDLEDLSAAFLEKSRSLGAGNSDAANAKAVVARVTGHYPEDRQLTGDLRHDTEMIFSVVSPEAVVAAGGRCPPSTPRYDLPGISVDSRPIRENLPGFRATRGAINYMTTPTLADVGAEVPAGVQIFTVAEDVSEASYPKPCLVVECGDPVEVEIQIITKCMQIGNLNRIFYPELFDRYWQLLGVHFSRTAEDELWNRMCSLSVAADGEDALGAVRTFVGVIGRRAAAFRSRHRTADNLTLNIFAPSWLRDLFVVDMWRQMPGDDVYGRVDSIVAAAERDVNVKVTYSPDAGGQYFGAVGDNPWPLTVELLMFHEGAFIYLDGGSLDLGTEIRDSVLNEGNNVRAFYESFENVALVGIEPQCITLDICPSGAAAELAAVACIGS